MSNFWKTSDGKEIEKKSDHESGGAFEVIPDGTKLLAVIEEAGWKAPFEHGGPDVIQIKWGVLAPDPYKGRKVFQKIKVNDEKDSTADNAKRMLMAIDQNAGGKLSKMDTEPGDNELMGALMGRPMIIRMSVWEMDGKTGNWVSAVSPRKAQEQTKAAEQKTAEVKKTEPVDSIDEGTIPF